MKALNRHNLSVVYALVLGGLMLAVALPAAAEEKSATDASSSEAIDTPIVHNPVIEVHDGYVRLGDLFDPIERYADRVVARAPEPGQELVLPAMWLWKAAKTFGVDWQPATKSDTVTVIRPSAVVSTAQIEELIRDAHFRRTGEDDLVEMETAGVPPRIDLPVTASPTARVDRFELDTRSGRFSATVVAPATGRTLERVHVTGRFHRLVEVPVPVTRLGRDHIIRERDIEIRRLREEGLGANLIVDPARLVGQSVRRSLSGGEPVRTGDVQPPVLVEKNRIVTVTLKTDTMVLTVQGRALEDGAEGETIRVQNTQSTTVIDAIVTGPGRVDVRLNGRIAMATQ